MENSKIHKKDPVDKFRISISLIFLSVTEILFNLGPIDLSAAAIL
jgi:hypothetical protein